MNTFPRQPVLCVDDEADILDTYRNALNLDGIDNVILESDSRKVDSILREKDVSVAVIDLSMPHVSGHQILETINESYPDIQVIVVTGINEVETAVDCMKAGAADFMVKPVDNSRLTTSIRKALELRDLRTEVVTLRRTMLSDELNNPHAFAEIITVNPRMRSIFKYIEAVARTPRPVLITGESGTGKELIAKAVHMASGRNSECVTVNVAGLDDTMFSDTLFGHKRGAFTGAENARSGLIERASSGTLFLDEIGDLDNSSQVKLLRLLQDREYYPLGSDVVKISDARIVAATNTDLEKKQQEGTFRNDLYFRLITHQIHIPPLRERKEDIPFLLNHFIEQAASSIDRDPPVAHEKLPALLSSYHFPGNIRELQAIVFDAVSRCESGVLPLTVFSDYIKKRNCGQGEAPGPEESETFSLSYSGRFPRLKEVEDYFIKEALTLSNGNQSIAATYLGINQSTLSRRLRDQSSC